MKRLVVYTAVFGGRDPIKFPPEDRDFDFFAFTDSPVAGPGVIQIPPPVQWSLVRSARNVKILPEKFLKGYRYSLWIDGSIMLQTGSLDWWIDRYLSRDTPLATFQHPLRTCLYQEASVCLSSRLGEPDLVIGQAAAYRAAGLPEGTGLAETGVMLRDHEGVREFSEVWWSEFQAGSCRDQISFPFAAWKTGLRWAGLEESIRQNSHFQLMPHN